MIRNKQLLLEQAQRFGIIEESPDNLKAFIDGMIKLDGYEGYERGIGFIYSNDTIVDAKPFDKKIYFNILSMTEGQGNATATMKRIIDLANRTGVTLFGDIKPFGSKVNKMNAAQKKEATQKLRDWYQKLGFTVKGNKIIKLPDTV